MLCISERRTQDWPFNDKTLYLSAECVKKHKQRGEIGESVIEIKTDMAS